VKLSSFRAGRSAYAAWVRDWHDFVVNERPIVPHIADPSSLVVLKRDHGLTSLFLAHHRRLNTAEGGDVIAAARLATYCPCLTAKAIIEYVCPSPMSDTMTLMWNLPDGLNCLWPMLKQGGYWSTRGPRPDFGMTWIPAAERLPGHFVMTAASSSMPVGGLNQMTNDVPSAADLASAPCSPNGIPLISLDTLDLKDAQAAPLISALADIIEALCIVPCAVPTTHASAA
jgi:hypothetical protein